MQILVVVANIQMRTFVERYCQVASLVGAAHLLKDNVGVLR